MMRAMVAAILLAGAAWGQTFEVSSIQEQDYNAPGRGGGVRAASGRLTVANTLKGLIVSAYDLRDSQVTGGPTWMAPPGPVFVITVKVVGRESPTPAQIAHMMQKVLADRFKLKLHRETKDLGVYDLVVDKGGAKMKVSGAASPDALAVGDGPLIEARMSMASLALKLTSYAGRRVVDKTGLNGNYDVRLEWAAAGQPDGGPTLFTAIQEQLGLRLVPSTAATEMLVIDHAEKPSD
jgi:uncharacterized protein (TIGR03435 family)